MRIAVLCHEAERGWDLSSYLIHHFAGFWREEGHEVVFAFGADDFVPADLAILHVDLSVVPDAYMKLAGRYPVVLNARVRDIRKSSISRNLVARGDPWKGPVIVKSDLNCGGGPERMRGQHFPKSLHNSLDYRVYPRLRDVPRTCFRDPDLVVERFLPEREGELYCVRLFHFLGDCWSCSRMLSRQPIVNGRTECGVEAIETHPEIVALRHRLGFDYGKLDYVIHDGEPVLLDANKTVGVGALSLTPERLERWRRRAAGIQSYFV